MRSGAMRAAAARRRPWRSQRLVSALAVAVALTVAGLVVWHAPVAVRAVAPVEVCFGMVLPLTSDRHIETLRIMDAMQLAANDVNADPLVLPNHEIHFITEPALIDSHGFVRFGSRRAHDQSEHGACVNGTAPVALIGDIDDDTCGQMATVASLLDLAMVSPGCRDIRFDARQDGVAYPMFSRVISGLLAEADVIKALMAHFQFREIVLWHSDSRLGSALSHSFAGTQFEVVDAPVPFTDTGEEVTRSLHRILTLRVRVIFIHAEEALGRLMMAAARREGMLNGDYLFFGSSLWTFGADEAHRVAFNEEERSYLQGVVGVALPTPPGLMLENFEDRLARLAPDLYAPFNTQATVSTVWHAYDSVKLLALAAHNLTERGLPVTGLNLMSVIRSGGVEFTGVVNDPVKMLPDGGVDPLLEVTNFRNGAFEIVGFWRAEGLVLSDAIVWPGQNAELHPSPEVPRTLLALHEGWRDASLGVMVVFLLGAALTHYLIHVNRSHEVIKAASPVFCHIIVFGSTLSFVMCGVSALDFTTYCRVVPSLVSVSFSTIFAALLAKTYRIHRIFNSEGLKISAPTSAYLLLTTFAVAGYDVVVSVVFMTVDAPAPKNLPSPADETTQYPDCGMNDANAWWLVYVLPKTLMLAFGAWLAYKVRHLNHNFNEAKYISLALYNVIVLSGILVSLIQTFHEVNTAYALKTVGIAICAFITICILFVPKFWDIYVTKDWIDYHSNSSYISGVLVHKSSKTGNRTADGILAGMAGGGVGIGVGNPSQHAAGVGATGTVAIGASTTAHMRYTATGVARPVGGGGSGPRHNSGTAKGNTNPYLHRTTKIPGVPDRNDRNDRRSKNDGASDSPIHRRPSPKASARVSGPPATVTGGSTVSPPPYKPASSVAHSSGSIAPMPTPLVLNPLTQPPPNSSSPGGGHASVIGSGAGVSARTALAVNDSVSALAAARSLPLQPIVTAVNGATSPGLASGASGAAGASPATGAVVSASAADAKPLDTAAPLIAPLPIGTDSSPATAAGSVASDSPVLMIERVRASSAAAAPSTASTAPHAASAAAHGVELQSLPGAVAASAAGPL